MVLARELEVREERRQNLRGRSVHVDRPLREHRHLGRERLVVKVDGPIQEDRSVGAAGHDDAQLRRDAVGDPNRRAGDHPASLDQSKLEARTALQRRGESRRTLPLRASSHVAERRRRATQDAQIRIAKAARHREDLRRANLLDRVDHLRAAVRGERPPGHGRQGALIKNIGTDAVGPRRQRPGGVPLAITVLDRADATLGHLQGPGAVELFVGVAEHDDLTLDDEDFARLEERRIRDLDRWITAAGGLRQTADRAQQVGEHLGRRAVEIDASREVGRLDVPCHSVNVVDPLGPVGKVDHHGQLVRAVEIGRPVDRGMGPLERITRVARSPVQRQPKLRTVLVEVACRVRITRGGEERRRQREQRQEYEKDHEKNEAFFTASKPPWDQHELSGLLFSAHQRASSTVP